MIPLQILIMWCLAFSGSDAAPQKRQVTTPEFIKGGFSGSYGPYGNEAAASTLNYQGGNQGYYNNIDSVNGYADYSGQIQSSQGNIPVQEQAEVKQTAQPIQVPVWSPPAPSQNPYIVPPQYQSPPQSFEKPPEQQNQQNQQSFILPQGISQQVLQSVSNYQQPSGILQVDGPAQSYAFQNELGNVPAYTPSDDSPPTDASSATYGSNTPPSDISATSYGSPQELNASSYGSIGSPSPISSGTPLRGFGKTAISGIPSISDIHSSFGSSYGGGVGGIHSLQEVFSGGINDFGSGSFGGDFQNTGFGFGGFGKNYFGVGLNSFDGLNSFNSPFSGGNFRFSGSKGGSGKINGLKFSGHSIPSSLSLRSESRGLPGNIPRSQNIPNVPVNLHVSDQNFASQSSKVSKH